MTEKLVAYGGLSVPVTPFYDLPFERTPQTVKFTVPSPMRIRYEASSLAGTPEQFYEWERWGNPGDRP